MRKRDWSWLWIVSVVLLFFLVARGEPGLLVGSHGGSGIGTIWVYPSPRNFGTVTVGGAASTYTCTVYNQSATTYSFDANPLTFTGTNAADWSQVSNACTTALVPYTSSCTFEVAFSAQATGARAGQAQLAYTSTW
jgi:hypothetical protein